MFKKKNKKPVVVNTQQSRPKVDAMLNRRLKIAGDVHFSGILHVECTIEGDLISDDETSTLILSLLEMAVGAGVNGKLVHHELSDPIKTSADNADINPSAAQAKFSV